jgi:hypothetical protein
VLNRQRPRKSALKELAEQVAAVWANVQINHISRSFFEPLSEEKSLICQSGLRLAMLAEILLTRLLIVLVSAVASQMLFLLGVMGRESAPTDPPAWVRGPKS